MADDPVATAALCPPCARGQHRDPCVCPCHKPTTTAATVDRLMAEVNVHLARCNNAPNEAVRFAEHAQALGLLKAVTIVKESQ